MLHLVRRKRLYLMPDYGSTGLWWEQGGMVDLGPTPIAMPLEDGGVERVGPLPLSDETKAALEAWVGQMYRWMEAEEGTGPPLDEAFDARFAAEEERLAKAIRAELPAEYDVGVARFDTGKKRIEWLPDSGS